MLKMVTALITILVAGMVYIETARPGTICDSFGGPQLYAKGTTLPAESIRVSSLDR
ncbi:MAG: hypothetical protein H6842_14720 [Rhodospirillaceae bacterium]|nr:hypothetical protein [Rhodospirillaceae bacterium]